MPQNPVRSPYLVFQNVGSLAKQDGASPLLVLDDLNADLAQVIHEIRLALPERRLIRDLEEVSDHLGSLTVEAAVGEADLGYSLQDFVDLFGQHEPGQVNQNGGPQAGPHVRRTAG